MCDDTVILNYKYKLYVNDMNKKLDELIISSDFAWNHIVKLSNRYYRMFHKSVNCNNMQKHMARLAKINPFWKKLDSQSMQEISQKYKHSLDMSFKLKRGFPKERNPFKNYGSVKFKQTGYRLDISNSNPKIGLLYINKLSKTKPFKFKLTRLYGEVRNITVKKDKDHTFYLIICTRVPKQHLERIANESVGIDMGMKNLMVTSDSEYVSVPEFVHVGYRKIAAYSRKISHKYEAKVFGFSFKRAKKDLNRAYDKLTDSRDNWQWNKAHELCKTYSFIAIEDLNIKGMMRRGKKRRFGKKLSKCAIYSFIEKLKYIATKYDTLVYQIDRWDPSSQICHICGHRTSQTKDLSCRKWICENCGNELERDFNAAKNILKIAINRISGKGISLDGSSSETKMASSNGSTGQLR